jgi:hypothetical protein
MEAGFSKYTNFCSSEKFKKKISLSNSTSLNRVSLRFWFTLHFKIKWASSSTTPQFLHSLSSRGVYYSHPSLFQDCGHWYEIL